MSDFYASVGLSRGEVSDMLCDSDEQCMWVLAHVATRIDASDLQLHIDNVNADLTEVMRFFRDLADLIEAGIEMKVSKVLACEMAWRSMEPGDFTAQDIADKANEIGVSDFCYRQDALNMTYRIGLTPTAGKFDRRSPGGNIYRKTAQ